MISTMVVKVVFIGMVEEEVMMSSRVNIDGAEVSRDVWTLESHTNTASFSFFPAFSRAISGKFTFTNDVKDTHCLGETGQMVPSV